MRRKVERADPEIRILCLRACAASEKKKHEVLHTFAPKGVLQYSEGTVGQVVALA